MLKLEYADGAYDITRISARMSDRAPNEQSLTKLMQKEKQDMLEQTEMWREMTAAKQNESRLDTGLVRHTR